LAVNKLNIEFEDDEEIRAREEAQRKKSEALGDVDLNFGDEDEAASANEARPKARQKAAAPGAAAKSAAAPNRQAPVEQARAAAPQRARPQVQESGNQQVDFQQLPTRQVYVGPEYKLGDELKKIAASNQILAIEIEARVKVEVTQQITELIAEHHAKNKLLEHKINKLLTSIHQKAPAAKAELMSIKKLLKEQASLGEEPEVEAEAKPAAPKKANPAAAAKKKAA
jgi:predicted RNA-binding protein YlxR (DUF448 family)